MRVLGIETSCDETAASVVINGRRVYTNIVSSSLGKHAKTGGIIPEIAAREQAKAMIPVLKLALGNLSVKQIDIIAVTQGPGLIGSLLVGVETAKTLSYVWDKPLIAVNHMVGHIYANWLLPKPPTFPLLVLLVSGGHTELVLMKDHGKYKIVGSTRDDAAGEAFDKTARLLGLPYPGGPQISKLAEVGNPSKYPLPRPMLESGDLDFSFSGLKTAVLSLTKKVSLTPKVKRDISASIQEAIIEVLVEKTIKAAQKYKVKNIALGGGVAANIRLRQAIKERWGGKLFIPPPPLCTDNGAVIATVAFYNPKLTNWSKLEAKPNLTY